MAWLFGFAVLASYGPGNIHGASAGGNWGACLAEELLYGTTPFKSRYEAICCKVPQHAAEHWGFQSEASVRFFDRLVEMEQASGPQGVADAAGVANLPGVHMRRNANNETEWIFYDSQCGKPLYVAPRGRSFAAWRKESVNHGWPSFRDEELVQGSIEIRDHGEVVSTCPQPTHQGHRFVDDKGYRYCIDLICMAGHEASPLAGHVGIYDMPPGQIQGGGDGGDAGRGGGNNGGSGGSGGDFSPHNQNLDPGDGATRSSAQFVTLVTTVFLACRTPLAK